MKTRIVVAALSLLAAGIPALVFAGDYEKDLKTVNNALSMEESPLTNEEFKQLKKLRNEAKALHAADRHEEAAAVLEQALKIARK